MKFRSVVAGRCDIFYQWMSTAAWWRQHGAILKPSAHGPSCLRVKHWQIRDVRNLLTKKSEKLQRKALM